MNLLPVSVSVAEDLDAEDGQRNQRPEEAVAGRADLACHDGGQ